MPVELTILSSWTSRPFCLKKPPSSAIHSGRLSAMTLLYETLSATGGPEKPAAGARAGAGVLVGAGAAVAPVVGLATTAWVGAAACTAVGAAVGAADEGGAAAG